MTNWHYFFYGITTDDGVAGMIHSAEDKGCEYLQLIPGMIPTPPQALALPSAPKVLNVLKIFVRCRKDEYEAIHKLMVAEAAKQQLNGFRP